MTSGEKLCIFHIGGAPTAAWLLQRCLTRNEHSLHRQGLGLLHDDILKRTVGTGDKLTDDPEPFATALVDELTKPEIEMVVASHGAVGPPIGDAGAGLYPSAGPRLAALAQVTRSYRRLVVLSISPQQELVEALYMQAINAGRWAAFEDWLEAIAIEQLSWLPLHQSLIQAFGAADVRVLDYRPTAPGRAAFLRRFFDLLGIDLPSAAADAQIRPGLSEKALRVAIAANPYLISAAERANLRDFLARHFSDFDYSPAILLADTQKATLRDLYARELEGLIGQPGGTTTVSASETATDGPR